MVHHSTRRSTAAFLLVLAGLAWATCAVSFAQPLPPIPAPTPSAAPASPEPEAEASDSPRASVRAFLQLASQGDYAGAARYLALSGDQVSRGPELARRLRAVIERHLDVDFDALSGQPLGSAGDELPAGVDRIGTIPDGTGDEDPVFVTRTKDAIGPLWVFSRQTVARVDGWYDALEDRWIREFLPEPLLRYGPEHLMWWQWLAMPGVALLAYGIGRGLSRLTRAALGRAFARTTNTMDDRLLARVRPSITLLWSIVAAIVLLPWIALLPASRMFVARVLTSGIVLAVFLGLWRSVDVVVQVTLERPSNAANASLRSLVSVGGNLVKIFVVMLGLAVMFEALGYNVATVLAGLGIGGIALAFGAQKTVENLFGSIALATDQPLRVGDFVKFEDVMGTVEAIGTRSTRFRTLDRTLVTVPNGKLADSRIETFGVRDRIRLTFTLGLVYGTTREQITRVLDGIERLLRAHPATWPDTVVVRFAGFGASSLDVEVLCWCATADFDRFRAFRQEVLLGVMDVVAQAGTDFAFPTRTVHVVHDGAPGAAAAAPTGPGA